MSTTRRFLVLGLPVLIVTAIWWVTSWNADASSVEASNARQAAAQQATIQAASQIASATEFRDGGAASQAQLEALRTALPDTPDIGRFVLLNGAAADAAGVVVSDLAPEAPGLSTEDAPTGTQAIGIDMAVVGTQSAVDSYLEQLAALPRIIAVDELSTSRASDTTVELSIHARIFQLGDAPRTKSSSGSSGTSGTSGTAGVSVSGLSGK